MTDISKDRKKQLRESQAATRQRKKEAGLVQTQVWVHESNRKLIREIEKKLQLQLQQEQGGSDE